MRSRSLKVTAPAPRFLAVDRGLHCATGGEQPGRRMAEVHTLAALTNNKAGIRLQPFKRKNDRQQPVLRELVTVDGGCRPRFGGLSVCSRAET